MCNDFEVLCPEKQGIVDNARALLSCIERAEVLLSGSDRDFAHDHHSVSPRLRRAALMIIVLGFEEAYKKVNEELRIGLELCNVCGEEKATIRSGSNKMCVVCYCANGVVQISKMQHALKQPA